MPRRIRREPCRAERTGAGCYEPGAEITFGFCAWHWDELPEDLQDRVQWATEEGGPFDLDAAIRAALDHLADTAREGKEEA